jgi:DNA-binding response OmpR family regulator
MSPKQPVVLNVEDDADIALVIRTLLGREGYRVISVPDGREGLRCFHDERPDLVILDVGLPTLDGWTVIERLRELSSVPILVLSSRGSEDDKVRGLRAGADDYLGKPFGNGELLARVEVLLRRAQERGARPGESGGDARGGDAGVDRGDGSFGLVAEHGIEVDFGTHTVRVDGEPVSLTPIEFRLLETLMTSRGQVLSPEQLLHRAWRDPTATGPDRVKFAVLRLRRKLGWGDPSGGAIETVRGFGYRYRAPQGRRPSQSVSDPSAGS